MNRQVAGLTRALLAPKSWIRDSARSSSAYKAPASWFDPTLSEMPVPEGSWQAFDQKRQRKNNRHLIIGGSFFLFTMVVLRTSGLIQLNATIPKLPDEYKVGGS